MILVTTTPSVDGYTITNYQGIVFGEVVSGVNMFKDLGAGLRNMFGGRSQGYEEELMRARNEAIAEMQQRAEAMGAHAVVGVDIDYEVLGADNGMLMVTASAPPCRSRVRPEPIGHRPNLGQNSSIKPHSVGYRDALHWRS